jgi:hypothetical protein
MNGAAKSAAQAVEARRQTPRISASIAKPRGGCHQGWREPTIDFESAFITASTNNQVGAIRPTFSCVELVFFVVVK